VHYTLVTKFSQTYLVLCHYQHMPCCVSADYVLSLFYRHEIRGGNTITTKYNTEML